MASYLIKLFRKDKKEERYRSPSYRPKSHNFKSRDMWSKIPKSFLLKPDSEIRKMYGIKII